MSKKDLKLSIQIAGKIDKSLASAIGTAKRSVGGLSKTLGKIGTAGLTAMTGMTAGVAAGIMDATKNAKDFEKQMADVVKYVDGIADSTGQISDKLDLSTGRTFKENYGMMKDAILELSSQIPVTAEDLTKLASAAGQSGKSMDELITRDSAGNLGGFLKDVAMMGTAMDIDAEKAGNWAAKWEKSFKMNHDEIMTLSDQINYLGANSATTAAEIGEVVNRAGSIGQLAGSSVSTTAALADAMLATGVQSNRAGTGLKNLFTRISMGNNATKAQQETWQELGFTAEGVAKSMQKDSTQTLLYIFGAIDRLPEDKRLGTIKELFGMWTTEGAGKIVNNLSTFTDALNMVNDPSLYKGSMEREFIIKTDTTEAVDTMMKNAWKGLKIDLGTEFLPVKKQFATMLIDLMKQVREHMPELKKLGQTLAQVLAKGVDKLGDALNKGLPIMQRGLDYINNNGGKVAKILGGITAAFAGMKAAPLISTLASLGGGALFGEKSNFGGSKRKGGLLTGLFNGAKNRFGKSQMVFNGAKIGMDLAGSSAMTAGAMGKGGFFSRILNRGVGAYYGAKNAKGLTTEKGFFGNLLTTASNIKNTQGRGLKGEALLALRGMKARVGNKVNGGILGNVLGGLKTMGGGVTGFFGNMINGANGLTASGGSGIKALGSDLLGSVKGLGGGLLGGIKQIFGGGGGLLGKGAGLLGGVLSGGLPIVGGISAAVGAASLLYDNLDGVRDMIGNVFGEKGLAVFDSFKGGLDSVIENIGNILSNGIGDLIEPMKEKVVDFFREMFGDDVAEGVSETFDSIIGIIDSLLGVLGQVVSFANTYVKPIISNIFNFVATKVVPFITNVFNTVAPLIKNVIGTIGGIVMKVAGVIAKAIQKIWPLIEGIASIIMNIVNAVLPVLVDAFTVAWDVIGGIIDTVTDIFGGVITFLTQVFTGDWEGAWQTICDFFEGIWDSIKDIVKGAVNVVIDIINGMISGIIWAINKAKDFLLEFGTSMSGAGGLIDEDTMNKMKDALNIDAPQIPHLAKGGFTAGTSIAGEAGTEAVISFDPSARSRNIETWLRAGKMLGIGQKAKEIKPVKNGQQPTKVIFAPNITIQGNADEDTVSQMMSQMQGMLDDWWEKRLRNQIRTAY